MSHQYKIRKCGSIFCLVNEHCYSQGNTLMMKHYQFHSVIYFGGKLYSQQYKINVFESSNFCLSHEQRIIQRPPDPGKQAEVFEIFSCVLPPNGVHHALTQTHHPDNSLYPRIWLLFFIHTQSSNQ